MAFLKHGILEVIRCLTRTLVGPLIGAAIGITVVVAYVTVDYLAQTDKQFYFLDRRPGIITLLWIGVVIGAVIGGWGLSRRR
jgi:hypothetical protein